MKDFVDNPVDHFFHGRPFFRIQIRELPEQNIQFAEKSAMMELIRERGLLKSTTGDIVQEKTAMEDLKFKLNQKVAEAVNR